MAHPQDWAVGVKNSTQLLGLKYLGPASAESAHKHGKGSYKMCEGLPVSILY